MKHKYVTKSTGRHQRFSRKKFEQSLENAGVERKTRKKVRERIEALVGSGTATEQVERHALQCLLKEDAASACRYHLKRAIMNLGPTGYPFEDYIGAVLARHGYRTRVGRIVPGKCVAHEIDVVARQGKEWNLVECKFHSTKSARTDVQVALYMQARFQDIQTRDRSCIAVWIMTNTRFTSEALTYGLCSGMEMISWDHPSERALKRLVEHEYLYPITIFPWLPRRSVQGLINTGVVLAEDVLQVQERVLRSAGQLKQNQLRRLVSDAQKLFAS